MTDKFNISQKYLILVVLMIIILTLGVYWPVQNYEFINYDDQGYVTNNFRIQQGITTKSIKDTLTDIHTSNWHPLTMMSHMVDWQLFGDRAGGHHWTNVIIHIFNIILLFFLFRNITGAIWSSAFVAALFAIHPINVESVAWIAERKNVLSTFFWLLTMIFYVWYVKKPHWKRYLPVFISFALGLMSKPMLVTLPFVLLLLDYWPLNRTAINTQNEKEIQISLKAEKEKINYLILEKIPLIILSVISIFITLYASHCVSLESLPLSKRIFNAVVSYVMYINKLFWPTDLSVFYSHIDISLWQIFLSAIFLISITLLIFKYFRKYPYLFVGWFWYLGTLIPVIGIVQVGEQSMADRYAYVTFIGLFVIIAWGAEQILSKYISFKKLFIFASFFIILLFTVVTHYQIKLWANTVTLFEDALKKDPNNYVAYQTIGLEMANNGENEKALYYYDMALKANPRFDPAYNNRGLILVRMGRRYEAYKNFEKALQLNNYSAEAYYNLGAFYLHDNNLEKSIECFSKVIKIKPEDIAAYNILGVVLVKKGKIQEGILQFEKALHINPYYKDARNNLQIALEMKKKSKDREIIP
ncbi:MAG: tetratricopeptide repeat protein [Deltaproteobacteria bacterium]|nr:tetratricopeptide repeat protein [Deltaproteobacteria bacterium]